MLNRTIAAALALVACLGFSQSPAAAEEIASPATVVIYRADESVKTSRLNLDISANSNNLGRLSRGDVVVARGPAGTYTLGSSIAGTEPLTLDLKPGATYYIHAGLELRGGRIHVSLQQVPEQVAKVQQPTLEGAI